MKLLFWIPLLASILLFGCSGMSKNETEQEQKYHEDLEKCVVYMQLAYYINTSIHLLNYDVWQAYNKGEFRDMGVGYLTMDAPLNAVMFGNKIKIKSTDCYKSMQTYINKTDSLVSIFRSSSFKDSDAFDELITLFADIKLFNELAENPHGNIAWYKDEFYSMESNIDRELLIFKLKYGIESNDKDSIWSANILNGTKYPDTSELSFSKLYPNN